jgi:hypothetical protein
MQVRCRWWLTVAAALVLALTAGQSPCAGPARPKPKPAGPAAAPPAIAQAASDAMSTGEANAAQTKAAFVEMQVNRLRQAFPGNDSTWFVLVMHEKSSDGRVLTKTRRFAIVQGRTAAALAVYAFFSSGKPALKGFQYYAFARPGQAQAYCLALMEYSRRNGYR